MSSNTVRATEPLAALVDAPADEPIALLHSCGRGTTWLFRGPLEVCEIDAGEVDGAFERIGEFLARNLDRRCVGYLGYDLRDAVEPLPRTIEPDLELPVAHLVAYERADRWTDVEVPEPPAVEPARDLRARLSRDEYQARVAAIVEHIRAGDIFQANLTQPFTARFDGDPRALFWRLCRDNPAPFAAYLQTGDGVSVLSSSPEEFLKVEGDAVRSRPIKGTRPRAKDPFEDAGLLTELIKSEKDRAELAMIVDLMRNDLGRHAVPGSVAVGEFPAHASYAHVHHLFAEVTAKLTGVSLIELLEASFPPGSVTGAPKLRCMELIEQYEVVRRGVYTGAIGWIGPARTMHLNVAIRTMTLCGDRLRFNTGGGVTADSDPASEYQETLHKAAGIVQALQAEIES